jgi:hypothetical protein
LTSLQQQLVKNGGQLVKHAIYCGLLLAESYLTRCLFGSMLQRILPLPLRAEWAREFDIGINAKKIANGVNLWYIDL